MSLPSEPGTVAALHSEPVSIAIPPRFRWLRIILLGTFALVLLLAALRGLWGWRAERRLLAEIERIRTRGEPIDAEHFAAKDDPAGRATAQLIVSAAEDFDWGPDGEPLWDELNREAIWPLEEMTEVRAIIEANSEVLARFDRALRSVPPAWPQAVPSMKAFAPNPFLSDARRFSQFLAQLIRYDHQRGDHRAAVAGFERSAFLARVIGSESGLIPHLVHIACDALLVRQVQYLAPTLCVAPFCDADDLTLAPREAVESLIDAILDDSHLRSSVQRAFQFERVLVVNMLRELADGDLTITRGAFGGVIRGQASAWQRAHVFPLAPLLLDRAALYLRQSPPLDRLDAMNSHAEFRQLRLALPASDWDQRLRHAPGIIGGLFDILMQLSTDGNEHALRLHLRLLTEHRLAAVRLALRLYELEHGRMPETLDVLAPDYLPAIPDDPFAPEGTGFRYRPFDVRPVLYSIGANEVDDGGTVGTHWIYGDIVFYLDGIEPERD